MSKYVCSSICVHPFAPIRNTCVNSQAHYASTNSGRFLDSQVATHNLTPLVVVVCLVSTFKNEVKDW